jgi:hypothetical protein
MPAVNFTLRSLYPWGNSFRYQLYRRLGGPQSRSGRYWEEKNLTLAGIWTPAVQPVAIPTELSRLSQETEIKYKKIIFYEYKECTENQKKYFFRKPWREVATPTSSEGRVMVNRFWSQDICCKLESDCVFSWTLQWNSLRYLHRQDFRLSYSSISSFLYPSFADTFLCPNICFRSLFIKAPNFQNVMAKFHMHTKEVNLYSYNSHEALSFRKCLLTGLWIEVRLVEGKGATLGTK